MPENKKYERDCALGTRDTGKVYNMVHGRRIHAAGDRILWH